MDEPETALVILSFLQADYKSANYRDELASLEQEVTQGIDLNGCTGASLDDGCLETDGLRSTGITFRLRGVEFQRLAAQQVAEELKDIADQLEHRLLAEATQNLRRNLLISTSDKWQDHLSREVSRVMMQSVTLKECAQEHITLALTLALVKGVCEQTPQLLRNLFTTTLHYIVHSRTR
ncbi:BH3 interacting domain death agonist isoform X2 [Takifugu flavidus]|uniref:BH3 interacting domain death agonist isoform X2 n=1 Tax=Takifugu flavidus TaxID=433684 RepID=UPI0025446C43|nr:BH3 interacting domain death agonist isoform X2 [Takifugu flavidus]